MRAAIHFALCAALVSCAESPRLDVLVQTDLNVPEQIDHLAGSVEFGDRIASDSAALSGSPPYRFSVQGEQMPLGPATLTVDLLRGTDIVASMATDVDIPAEGNTCIAVHLFEDGTSATTACDATPKRDAGMSTDGGPRADGGEPRDGGVFQDGGLFQDGGVEFPFQVKNIDPAPLLYDRPFIVPSNRECDIDTQTLVLSAGCGSPPPRIVVQSQPQGEDVAVISASTIELGGAVRVVGTRSLALVSSGVLIVSALFDNAASGVVAGAGAGMCTGGDAETGNCREGSGGGGGGGGRAGGTGGIGGSDCLPGAAGPQSIRDSVEPLVGGCTGGRGGRFDELLSAGGAGGGAIQLVALDVVIQGTIELSGGGGKGAQAILTGVSGGGGGGGGGALLVQSVNLLIGEPATIHAYGGGGGGGGGSSSSGLDGEDGREGGDGAGNVSSGGSGGSGARGGSPDDGDDASGSGGGAGGGSGVVRFESTSCAIHQDSDIRPDQLGSCP